MPNKIHLQQEDARFRVMRLLQDNPEHSQRDIASALGLSLGGINFCINALIEKGFIKIHNYRVSDNKLRYAYLLTPNGIVEKTALTSKFLKRKMSEYDALKIEIETIQDELKSEIKPNPNALEN